MRQKIKYFCERYPVALLLIVFLFTELIINPIGNFPLNDDWWYADSYKKLFEDHSTNKIPWGATSLCGQLLLTKIYVLIFGYSYTTLRFFTLILSCCSIIFLYKIFTRFLNLDTYKALLICLIFLFSPLFLALSNSYMSDVPFLFFLLGGLHFYLCFRQKNSRIRFCLVLIFFCFAILTRQLTIALLVGILVTEVVVHRKLSFQILVVFLLPAAVLFCFEVWIQTKINNPIYTFVFFRHLPILNKIPLSEVLINLCKRWIHFLDHSAFVLFPLMIPYLFYYFKQTGFKINKQLVLTLILSVPVFISLNKFPLGNYLYNFGIGPDTLYDFFTPEYGTTLQSPFLFILMKVIAYISSFAIILAIINFIFSKKEWYKKENIQLHYYSLLFLISICFYYGALCFSCAIFDRYTVPFTLFIVLLLHEQFAPLPKKNYLMYSLFALLILFSTLGTKDYLNSMRYRWEAVRILKDEHKASDKEINAGYEHEGSSFPDNENWYPKWANVPPNTYMVSRQQLKGYVVLGSVSYRQYMPYRIDTIFYLKSDTITGTQSRK